MKAPLRFYKSGLPSHINATPTGEQNTGDTAGLLKWISDVTIKRRQIRRVTRCSNLLAEAVLSNSLRKAKKDLAHKQEEKRNRIRLFCLSRGKKVDSSDSSDFELVKNVFPEKPKPSIAVANSKSSISNSNSKPYQLSYVLKDLSSCNNSRIENVVRDGQQDRQMMTDSEADDEVKACLSSLESFFKDLKSVKVKA